MNVILSEGASMKNKVTINYEKNPNKFWFILSYYVKSHLFWYLTKTLTMYVNKVQYSDPNYAQPPY